MSVRWIPRDEAVAIVDEWKSTYETRSSRLDRLSSLLRSQLHTQYQHMFIARRVSHAGAGWFDVPLSHRAFVGTLKSCIRVINITDWQDEMRVVFKWWR